jgi:hypothetical protein
VRFFFSRSADKVTDELLAAWQKTVKDLQKHMEQYQGVPMLLLFKKHQRASVRGSSIHPTNQPPFFSFLLFVAI